MKGSGFHSEEKNKTHFTRERYFRRIRKHPGFREEGVLMLVVIMERGSIAFSVKITGLFCCLCHSFGKTLTAENE